MQVFACLSAGRIIFSVFVFSVVVNVDHAAIGILRLSDARLAVSCCVSALFAFVVFACVVVVAGFLGSQCSHPQVSVAVIQSIRLTVARSVIQAARLPACK